MVKCMNEPYILSVLNQKGGVGKTTLVINIGKAFHEKGYKVLLIDSDPQGSLRDWNEANQGSILPVIGLDRDTLANDIKAVKNGYDIIIIDGAPRSEKLTSAAVKVSDMVLIAVNPSPFDVVASADFIEIVKARQEITDGQPLAAFIPNRTKKNTRTSIEISEDLEDYGFPCLETVTTDLQIYVQTPRYGETVFCDYKTLVNHSEKEYKDKLLLNPSVYEKRKPRDISKEGLQKAQEEISNITDNLINIIDVKRKNKAA